MRSVERGEKRDLKSNGVETGLSRQELDMSAIVNRPFASLWQIRRLANLGDKYF